jgi:hypothetical protein
MTNKEYREEVLSTCTMAALDCKESADYARYAFEKGNEAEARRYVDSLAARVQRLQSHLHSLDYANKKIAEESTSPNAQVERRAPSTFAPTPGSACGGWQCPRCFIQSGIGWSGKPDPNEAPHCCGGEPMVAYRIQVPKDK